MKTPRAMNLVVIAVMSDEGALELSLSHLFERRRGESSVCAWQLEVS